MKYAWTPFALLLVLGCIPATGQTTASQVLAVAGPEMPVRGGNIVVKVAAFDVARRSTLGAAASQGAELLAARTLVDAKGRKHGWLEFRLPAARLPALLGAVSRLGKLYGESVATTDHASEYEELARRIVRLQQHEVRLGGILSSGRRLRGGDLLYVQERLFRASVDESLLAQRRADLERSTQVNTVRVELFEPGSLPAAAEPPPTLAHGFGNGLALARTHFWLPGLILGLLLLRFLWSRRFAALRVLEAGLRQIAAWGRRLSEASERGRQPGV